MHDEKLAAGRVWMHSSCHGKNSWCVGQSIWESILRKFAFDRIAGTAHASALRTAALDHKASDNSMKVEAVIETGFYKTDKIVDSIWGDFGYNSAFITSPFAMVMVTIGFAICILLYFMNDLFEAGAMPRLNGYLCIIEGKNKRCKPEISVLY